MMPTDRPDPATAHGRRLLAAEMPGEAVVFEDWTQSTVPPPLLGVEGVEHGEPFIPLVVIGDDIGNDEGRAVRRLRADQARDLAALLDTRADVIDPPAAAPAVPAAPDAATELRRMADSFESIAKGSHGWVIRADAASLRARADELDAAVRAARGETT